MIQPRFPYARWPMITSTPGPLRHSHPPPSPSPPSLPWAPCQDHRCCGARRRDLRYRGPGRHPASWWCPRRGWAFQATPPGERRKDAEVFQAIFFGRWNLRMGLDGFQCKFLGAGWRIFVQAYKNNKSIDPEKRINPWVNLGLAAAEYLP